ncbi:hypothetical protein VU12_15280 [Desulfobulbus sp. US4]|nr:hypothetical protein [Desulfobulbus sp. US4]
MPCPYISPQTIRPVPALLEPAGMVDKTGVLPRFPPGWIARTNNDGGNSVGTRHAVPLQH